MRKNCRTCNLEVDVIIQEMPETSIHYAKAICPICGKFIDWLRKPDNQDARTKSSRFTPESLGKKNCELCGRGKDKLGKRAALEVHHKDPIEEGGKDEIANILILCTACHRMAHFLRTYMHRHLDDFYSFYNDDRKSTT